MSYNMLIINPGSTSTKIAFYRNENQGWTNSIEHDSETTARYKSIFDQFDMRKELVLEEIAKHKMSLSELSAVVGRGGLLPQVKSGAYRVNQAMIQTLRDRPVNQHASNLGAALAYSIAEPLGIPSYIYDAVTVDEMQPIAHITGLTEMRRIGQGHNLNMRAAAIKYSELIGKSYSDMNILVAHLGGGITLSLHSKGRIIDMISDDEGSFSPERAGGLPGFQLIQMATSGEYDYASMMKKVQRKGGLIAHLGTADTREIVKRIENGDEKAKLVLDAMAYNVAKNIGKLTVVVNGDVDAIVLTGGIAKSEMISKWISDRVAFIAPVAVLPGENEMEALAMGALRILNGSEQAHVYTLDEDED